MMKAFVVAFFLTCLLATGVQAQETSKIPDLKGTWECTAQLHYKKHGHVKPEGKTGKLTVVSQEGRIFAGTVEWKHGKGLGKSTFSGVIDKDGVTVYVAGHDGGTRIAKLEGPDAFTLYFLWSGGNNPRAGFAEFKRVK